MDVKTATNKRQILPHSTRKMRSLSRSLDARPVDRLWTDVDECSLYCELVGCIQPQHTSQPRVMQGLSMIG